MIQSSFSLQSAFFLLQAEICGLTTVIVLRRVRSVLPADSRLRHFLVSQGNLFDSKWSF